MSSSESTKTEVIASMDGDDYEMLRDVLTRIAVAIETARAATDSVLIKVEVVREQSLRGERVQSVRHIGGKKLDGPNPRFVSSVALGGKVEPGTYLVRVRAFDSDAETWDWHDWRRLSG